MHHKRSIYGHYVNLHSELSEYCYHKMIFAFGRNIVSIFIPIYLLTLGYSLLTVLSWFLVARILTPFITFGGLNLENRLGMRKLILISLLMYPVYFFMILQIKTIPELFLLSAIFYSVLSSIYWSQESVLFLRVSKRKEIAFEKGVSGSLQSIVSLFAPIIGALILVYSGMDSLILIAGIILTLSIIPIKVMKKAHFKLKTSFHDRTKKHGIDKKTLIELYHRGFQSEPIWFAFPMILFIYGFELLEIGFVGFLISLVGVITPMIIGKAIDLHREKILLASSILCFSSWILFLLFPSKLIFFIISLSLGLASEGTFLSAFKKISNMRKERDCSFLGLAFNSIDDGGRSIVLIFMITILYLTNIETMILGIIVVEILFTIWQIRNMLGNKQESEEPGLSQIDKEKIKK